MLISTITSNISFIQLSLMHRITKKICKERWQHWCTKISGVKVLPTLLISTITSNMSFIQLSLMLSGYPASSYISNRWLTLGFLVAINSSRGSPRCGPLSLGFTSHRCLGKSLGWGMKGSNGRGICFLNLLLVMLGLDVLDKRCLFANFGFGRDWW